MKKLNYQKLNNISGGTFLGLRSIRETLQKKQEQINTNNNLSAIAGGIQFFSQLGFIKPEKARELTKTLEGAKKPIDL
jgi:bacteriocin-like protein